VSKPWRAMATSLRLPCQDMAGRRDRPFAQNDDKASCVCAVHQRSAAVSNRVSSGNGNVVWRVL